MNGKNYCSFGPQSEEERHSTERDVIAARLAAKVNRGRVSVEEAKRTLILRIEDDTKRHDMLERLNKYIRNI